MTISTSRRLQHLLVLAASTFTLVLAGASTSHAAYDEFACSLPSGHGCAGQRHSLRAVSVWNDTNTWVGAGASPTGSFDNLTAGGVLWGPGYTCKGFTGALLYPLIVNGASQALRIEGLSSYGERTEGC
ncbi:hypothetical protein [Patulibacter americanus]|uniref:hypothetical protein n=1 Tax=Patulibacter americanus TaxID=588672 RepID=UPI0012FCF9EF|nr:hypothetical protein [Patulibacter americanus]